MSLLSYRANMNVGVAHSEVNPNTRVMSSRGIWLTYALGVGLLHIVLLSIPFFSVPVAWTLTNVIHNLVRTRRILSAGSFRLDGQGWEARVRSYCLTGSVSTARCSVLEMDGEAVCLSM